ncbi:MAG: DUF3887 domain-containing protein [Lachnospiraceae bacterium]
MQKKYVKKIIRGLKCSGKRRNEIRQQLSAEIMADLENGEPMEGIMERMGSPKEIAEEFNRSFSTEEQKKYKKEKRNKILLNSAVLLLLLGLAVYCFLPKSKWLSDSSSFQEEEVLARAEEIILLVEEDDYAAIQECAAYELKSYFDEDSIRSGKTLISPEWGTRESMGKPYSVEVTQMGRKLAVVQINVSYENTSVTYTISFNENMELAGLYMR